MAKRGDLERAKNFFILDFGTRGSSNSILVEEIVEKLLGDVGMFKIGLNLLTKEGGLKAISAVKKNHGIIFYDGNFNDQSIEVIKQSVEIIVKEGVKMFTVNMSFGALDIVRQAVESKGESEVCVVIPPSGDFAIMAQHAFTLGCSAVLCSPEQLINIRLIPELSRLKKVVYGVLPAFMQGENPNVMTLKEAINFGANHIILNHDDIVVFYKAKGILREEVTLNILEEIAEVFNTGKE